jgi:NAD(P)-dependent dehydrogenase (short-subunit alcohol dehydrogenase family)
VNERSRDTVQDTTGTRTPDADPRRAQDDHVDSDTIGPPGLTRDMDQQPDHGERSYTGSGRLTGQKALITGGDSGIGRAVAIAFAREGADIALSYLPEEESDARITADWVEREGRRAVLIPGDLSDESFARHLVDRAAEELGALDILVSNAAHQRSIEDPEDLSTEQMERTFRVNVFALYWLTQQALRHMKPGGRVITTSSIQAYDPSPGLLDYAATKAAIVNITKNLGRALMERGIRVNSVAPGPIWTPLIPATMPAEKVSGFGDDTPTGRAGQPAELAAAFVFFAAPDSSYVTGEVLGVTGGRLLP